LWDLQQHTQYVNNSMLFKHHILRGVFLHVSGEAPRAGQVRLAARWPVPERAAES
jgi:hypothetical protein